MSARSWLRAKLGPDPNLINEIDTLRATLSHTRQQLVCARTERDLERDAARKMQSTYARRLAQMLEPPVGKCEKVRLRGRDEAAAFAAAVERDTGAPPGALRTYACTVCPRQPVGIGRFWHVGNADPARRSTRGGNVVRGERERVQRQAAREGSLLRQRVDPSVLAHLRTIKGDTA